MAMSTTQILLSIFLGLVGLFFYYSYQKFTYWKRRGIACIKPHYLHGNMVGLGKTHSFADIWMETYTKMKGTGPFCGFYWGHTPAVFVLTPELAKLVLVKEFNKFTDRGFYSNPKHDPLSGQIFMLDGHKWRSMRQKLTPTFTSGKMKMMHPTIVAIADELTRVLGSMLKQNSVIEMKEVLACFTIDIIGNCAFGLECNSLKDHNSKFLVMGRKAIAERNTNKLEGFLMNSFPNLAKALGIKMTPDHITKFLMTIVRENIVYRESNNIKRNDFFDMLLNMKNNKLMKNENGESMSITVEEMAAQAFVFLLAGYESSSTLLAFALYELAQHEDIQQRARDEILEVLARYEGNFTYECMADMTYVNQIILETLRMYTTLPVLNRLCLEDYTVPGYPNYVIKKNMKVMIPAGAMHRDPELYPDPDTFNPERFSPQQVSQRDSIEFLAFGEGPRNCIGTRFGLMQTRIALSFLLKNFKFSICDKTTIPMEYKLFSYLVSPKGGIYLQVEKI